MYKNKDEKPECYKCRGIMAASAAGKPLILNTTIKDLRRGNQSGYWTKENRSIAKQLTFYEEKEQEKKGNHKFNEFIANCNYFPSLGNVLFHKIIDFKYVELIDSKKNEIEPFLLIIIDKSFF